MIAPEPFLEPRGTPFSVYHRAKALVTLGCEVDLVTYPLGKRVSLPGLHVYRTPSLPGVRHVKIGPSLAKLPLDMHLPSLLEGMDWVFHQAAQAGVRASWGKEFVRYVDCNVLATQLLLEAAMEQARRGM